MYTTVTELVSDWNYEAASTQKVLDSLTDESLLQQVSPNGRTLGQIAWHTTTSIPEFLSEFGFKSEALKDSDHVPSSAKEIAETFKEIGAKAAEIMKQQWTDDSLKQVQNAFGREMTNAAIVLLLIKHIIHHRGQMTVLMRQAEIKVPGVYGPAKEEWSQLGMEAPTI